MKEFLLVTYNSTQFKFCMVKVIPHRVFSTYPSLMLWSGFHCLPLACGCMLQSVVSFGVEAKCQVKLSLSALSCPVSKLPFFRKNVMLVDVFGFVSFFCFCFFHSGIFLGSF